MPTRRSATPGPPRMRRSANCPSRVRCFGTMPKCRWSAHARARAFLPDRQALAETNVAKSAFERGLWSAPSGCTWSRLSRRGNHRAKGEYEKTQASVQAAALLEAAVAPDGMIRIEFDRQAIDEAGVRAALDRHQVGKTTTAMRTAVRPSSRSSGCAGWRCSKSGACSGSRPRIAHRPRLPAGRLLFRRLLHAARSDCQRPGRLLRDRFPPCSSLRPAPQRWASARRGRCLFSFSAWEPLPGIMLNCMSAAPKFLVSAVTGWLSSFGKALRNLLALPADEDESASGRGVGHDFDGWIANDPMVTLNPASRYGDDATGFLAGSEADSPQPGTKGD